MSYYGPTMSTAIPSYGSQYGAYPAYNNTAPPMTTPFPPMGPNLPNAAANMPSEAELMAMMQKLGIDPKMLAAMGNQPSGSMMFDPTGGVREGAPNQQRSPFRPIKRIIMLGVLFLLGRRFVRANSVTRNEAGKLTFQSLKEAGNHIVAMAKSLKDGTVDFFKSMFGKKAPAA